MGGRGPLSPVVLSPRHSSTLGQGSVPPASGQVVPPTLDRERAWPGRVATFSETSPVAVACDLVRHLGRHHWLELASDRQRGAFKVRNRQNCWKLLQNQPLSGDNQLPDPGGHKSEGRQPGWAQLVKSAMGSWDPVLGLARLPMQRPEFCVRMALPGAAGSGKESRSPSCHALGLEQQM